MIYNKRKEKWFRLPFSSITVPTNLSWNTHNLTNLVIDNDNQIVLDKHILNIPVENGITGVGVNPITNRIYVSNSQNSTVHVIDGDYNTVI